MNKSIFKDDALCRCTSEYTFLKSPITRYALLFFFCNFGEGGNEWRCVLVAGGKKNKDPLISRTFIVRRNVSLDEDIATFCVWCRANGLKLNHCDVNKRKIAYNL